MNEMEFLNGINDLDPELLEDNARAKRPARARRVRWIAIAAALLLILGGTTAYAVSNGIILKKTSSPDGEQGYSAEATVPLVKWKEFKGEIRNAGSAIKEQYKTFTPAPVFSSTYVDPGSYSVSFGSIAEAMDYIGLAGLKAPVFPYDDFDECSVTSRGSEKGRVDSVTMHIGRIRKNEMVAQEYVTLMTEYAKDGGLASNSVWSPEFPMDAEFSYYTTPGGGRCEIAVVRPEFEGGRMGVTGYVISGSALYELHLGNLLESDLDSALEIIHAWADALEGE